VAEYDELEEIESKIMKAPLIRDRFMFLLVFYTGMRAEEVAGVHLENFDRKKSTVKVETVIVRNDDTGEYEEASPKSEAGEREIPIPSSFFDVLDEYLKYRGFLCLEIGFDQKIDVLELIENEEKFEGTYSKKDLYDNDRVIVTKLDYKAL